MMIKRIRHLSHTAGSNRHNRNVEDLNLSSQLSSSNPQYDISALWQLFSRPQKVKRTLTGDWLSVSVGGKISLSSYSSSWLLKIKVLPVNWEMKHSSKKGHVALQAFSLRLPSLLTTVGLCGILPICCMSVTFTSCDLLEVDWSCQQLNLHSSRQHSFFTSLAPSMFKMHWTLTFNLLVFDGW